VVVGRNVRDHVRTPFLVHVHDHGKKMELNGSFECGRQYEPQEKGEMRVVEFGEVISRHDKSPG